MLDLTRPDIDFALSIARQSGMLAQRIQSGMALMNLTKSDFSPATVSDYGVQAITARALQKAFPGAKLVGEETSADFDDPKGQEVLKVVTDFVKRATGEATAEEVCALIDRGSAEPEGEFWLLDPIDGTKGYLRGGQYAVALAFMADNAVQLGVLACPNLGENCQPGVLGDGVVAVAVRGEGAWWGPIDPEDGDFQPLKVSSCTNPAGVRILRSVESAHTNSKQVDDLAAQLGSTADPVRMDSQAKYAALAAGQAEALFRFLSPSRPDYKEKIWDHAAGSLVVEEAGGTVTDLCGKPLDFSTGRELANNTGLCASNGPMHERLLELVAEVTAGA